MNRTLLKLALVCLLAATALMATPKDVRACSCLPPDLAFSYNDSSDVFIGQVLGRVEGTHTNYFVFRIRATYKDYFLQYLRPLEEMHYLLNHLHPIN